MLKMLQEFPAN